MDDYSSCYNRITVSFFATLVNSEIKLSDISLFISLPMGTIIGTAFYALEKIKDNHKDD